MTDSLQPNSSFSHYRIISRLGEGGMGEVFLATDITLDRQVALKILPRDVSDNPNRLERFVREAKAASALNHPNVAYIHEIGEANGLHFLTMEYIEGVPLDQKIGDTPLPIPEIASLGAQIADALDAAHSKGIVHRDIKPANIMVTPRGYVKVLDFGLAKIVADSTVGGLSSRMETRFATAAGAVLGTVEYMSPEQALGKEVDHRTDIFSLGVVLYQMATARLPFAGSSTSETIARILQTQPEGMARFNYDVPEELDRVVRKCLEKDRERRYASARDLLVDLKALTQDRQPAPLPHQNATAERVALRAIIVDDEELARQVLREYLKAHDDVEIVAECANGFAAVKAASEFKPDLMFLDVQMPKLDGFEVLELTSPEIAVIFTTAFDNYAMRAFDAHAVDYLLKPFNADRLHTALQRAKLRIQAQPGDQPSEKPIVATELASAARAPDQFLQRIVVKDGSRVHIIPVDRLDFAEAQDDYVSLRTEKKNYLKQQTISSLEASLDPAQFIRVHRSFIVNIGKVTKIEPYTKDTRVAVLADGSQVPISRAGYGRLKEILDSRA